MIKRTPRVVFEGFCFDWEVQIDPENRDSLTGRGPELHPENPWAAWDAIKDFLRRKKKDEDWD